MNNSIAEKTSKILSGIPRHVTVAAAVKTRNPEEVSQAIKGGIRVIAHNYVQEAERMKSVLGEKPGWHLIGNLQRNKAAKAVRVFNMIETLDSVKLCREINRRAEEEKKRMPVLIQVNIGEEESKSGVNPREAGELLEKAGNFSYVSVEGLMAIEPFSENPEDARVYFRKMKRLFEELKSQGGENFRHLSMGMSRTYRIAVEEGANIIRLGTLIFGQR